MNASQEAFASLRFPFVKHVKWQKKERIVHSFHQREYLRGGKGGQKMVPPIINSKLGRLHQRPFTSLVVCCKTLLDYRLLNVVRHLLLA